MSFLINYHITANIKAKSTFLNWFVYVHYGVHFRVLIGMGSAVLCGDLQSASVEHCMKSCFVIALSHRLLTGLPGKSLESP